MPFKTDKNKLDDPFLKKNIKLIPCQKEMVKYWHNVLGIGIRQISRDFKVSRRLIQFILFPERHAKSISDRNDRGGSTIYYVKEKHTEAIRMHRKYKHEILKEIS